MKRECECGEFSQRGAERVERDLAGEKARDTHNDQRSRNEVRQLAFYTVASFVALLVDYGVYWLLAALGGMALGPAAAVGYIIGMAVSYLLLTQLVFLRRRHAGRPAYEVWLFIVSGLLGVTLTYVTVSVLSSLAGADLHRAKLAAVAVSFVAVYLFRKHVVFGPSLHAGNMADEGSKGVRKDETSP